MACASKCALKQQPVLDKAMLKKLERLSLLRFLSWDEVRKLEETIQLSNRIFEVDTSGVEPLHFMADELGNCPLRDDIILAAESESNSDGADDCSQLSPDANNQLEPSVVSEAETLQNAAETFEGYFVTPRSNIPLSDNPLFNEN